MCISAVDSKRSYNLAPQERWGVLGVIGKIVRLAVVVFIAVVGNALTLGIPLVNRFITDANKQSRKEEIEAKQIDHLYTALTLGLAGDQRWKPALTGNSFDWTQSSLTDEIIAAGIDRQDAAAFAEGVLSLRDAIYELKVQGEKTVEVGSLEKIYKHFQEFARSPKFMKVYDALTGTAPVNFLKALAAKFHTADMEEVLIQHAKDELGDIDPDLDGGYSIRKVGEVLGKEQEKIRFRRDNWLNSLIWAITHPTALYHSWESQARPDLYDSRESNPTYTIYETELDGKRVRFIAGPTPYNDPVYRKIFLEEGHELRFNIMDTSKKHEFSMIETMQEIAEESSGHLEHVVFGFATKEKRGYLDCQELNTLVDGYEKDLYDSRDLHSKTGVLISEEQVSDEEIHSICQNTKALMQELGPDLSAKEARHAVIVALDTMMALKILKKTLEKHPSSYPDMDLDLQTMYVSTACKQCFDRGPVYLLALLLFLRGQKTSAPLSKEEFYRFAGLPLFRAPLSEEGREQLKEKFIVFQSLTNIIGTRTDLISKYTKNI